MTMIILIIYYYDLLDLIAAKEHAERLQHKLEEQVKKSELNNYYECSKSILYSINIFMPN